MTEISSTDSWLQGSINNNLKSVEASLPSVSSKTTQMHNRPQEAPSILEYVLPLILIKPEAAIVLAAASYIFSACSPDCSTAGGTPGPCPVPYNDEGQDAGNDAGNDAAKTDGSYQIRGSRNERIFIDAGAPKDSSHDIGSEDFVEPVDVPSDDLYLSDMSRNDGNPLQDLYPSEDMDNTDILPNLYCTLLEAPEEATVIDIFPEHTSIDLHESISQGGGLSGTIYKIHGEFTYEYPTEWAIEQFGENMYTGFLCVGIVGASPNREENILKIIRGEHSSLVGSPPKPDTRFSGIRFDDNCFIKDLTIIEEENPETPNYTYYEDENISISIGSTISAMNGAIEITNCLFLGEINLEISLFTQGFINECDFVVGYRNFDWSSRYGINFPSTLLFSDYGKVTKSTFQDMPDKFAPEKYIHIAGGKITDNDFYISYRDSDKAPANGIQACDSDVEIENNIFINDSPETSDPPGYDIIYDDGNIWNEENLTLGINGFSNPTTIRDLTDGRDNVLTFKDTPDWLDSIWGKIICPEFFPIP